MKNSQKLLKAISAFTLTSVLLILVYYIGAIYPFGDHALFKWDMELQYIDFFHWWHRVLHGQASMSYSLSKSLGDNAIGLTAYYLSSPFNLLLYFTDNIPLFVSIATVLKLASASLTVSVFLSYRFLRYEIYMESAVICFLWINGIQFMSGKQHHVAGWCHMAADSDAGHMEASVRTQNSPALLFIASLLFPVY